MKNFFSSDQEKLIVDAIASAEKQTSGEIRLHVVTRCKIDAKQQAIEVFEKLGMTKTKDRNGVLIFLATSDKKFAIIGDQGIDLVVPSDFWNSVRDKMSLHFKNGDFVSGITEGIFAAGEKLKQFFPYAEDDQDELSNDISFGE